MKEDEKDVSTIRNVAKNMKDMILHSNAVSRFNEYLEAKIALKSNTSKVIDLYEVRKPQK